LARKVTNWVKGQLGEVAVKNYIERDFDIEVKLDFEIHKKIVPQDIIGVRRNRGSFEEPGLNVAIKASKPKSAYLVLSPNEVESEDRRSDVYIFCRPDLADDHLLRITRELIIEEVCRQPHYPSYRDIIPEFGTINCEVAGFCYTEELEVVNEIPGQDFDGERYVMQSGRLNRSREDWEELVERL